jgi:putative sterol carrier protein
LPAVSIERGETSVGHHFLSAAWVEATKAIRTKYEGETPKISQSIRLNLVVTDSPYHDGNIESFIDSSSGDLLMDLGALDKPDATITTDYDTARKIFVDQDQAAGMQAFMTGKIKVQGDMMKMMALQTAVPQTDATRGIATEIKEMTT